jgi:hypothetical protein
MKQDQGGIEKLIGVMTKAAARVHPSYVKIVTTCDPDGITRERVFCYELYHQMRLILGEITGIVLNGEIDKSPFQKLVTLKGSSNFRNWLQGKRNVLL